MRYHQLAAVAVLVTGLPTCNQGHSRTAQVGDPCETTDDCVGALTCVEEVCRNPLELVLRPWGPLEVNAFPNAEVTIKVVAYQSAGAGIEHEADLLPAAGEAIAWHFLGGDPGHGAALSTGASSTDAAGIAEVTVNVGSASNRSIQIRAAAAGAESDAFNIRVGNDDRMIEALSQQTVATVVNRTERLRARVVRRLPDGSVGPPIAGESIRVEFLDGARDGARLSTDPGDIVTLTTDGAGMVSVRFQTGTIAQNGYQVQFCSPGSCPGIQQAPLTFTFNVALRGSGGADCQYFTDCDEGYICDLGRCEPAASYCNDDEDCPAGYTCNNGTRQCELNSTGPGVCAECFDNGDCTAPERCGDQGHCVPADGCINNNDCPVGPPQWTCHECGACIPPGNPEDVYDVSGLWFTNYHFDISDTLPGFFTNGLGPVVDFLNLIFASQLEINVPILGDILEAMLDALIDEYVPDWVSTVVSILADFIHLFENMEVEGEMFIVQPIVPTPPPPRPSTSITGDEEWTSAQFFVVSFCPGGPAQFAQDPSCGRVDIILDSDINVDYSNEDLIVDVAVDPFTGQVMGDTLRINGRDAEIELAELINVLLDVITQIASNGAYADFETFLVDAVPCLDFQYAVDDLFCDITGGDICSVPGIEAACMAASLLAVTALNDALGNVSLNVLELGWDQRALIHDDPPVGTRADRLGDPSNPNNTAESALIGGSDFLFFGGDLDQDSWWYGLRTRD